MIELEKAHFFLKLLFYQDIGHNSFRAYKFLKTGVPGKYKPVSSRAKFTGLLYIKLMLI